MHLRNWLYWFAIASQALAIVISAQAENAERKASRPNVLVINTDDLGLGDVSCYNPQSAWQTPHIDRLAREGLLFTDAHSASSLCTPSRYALLTGRYAWRGRLKQGVLNGYGTSLIEPGRPTLPGFLRNNGYATAVIGKWHLGLDWKKTGPEEHDVDFTQPFGGGPLAHGFQRFFGISASLDMPPYVWLRDDQATMAPTGKIGDSDAPRLWRGGPIAADFKMEEVQPRLIEEAMAYLASHARSKRDRPFFLYIALASPHTPVLPTDGYAGKTGITSYGDFVTQVDADVGRVMEALQRHHLDQNTLVIFTSDNGFAPAVSVPEHRRHGHDPSAGYRGYKSDLFEGGHRIPFIARWPGHVPAGRRTSALIGQVDLFATCAELLGVPPSADAAEDSESFLPQLRGEPGRERRKALVNHSSEGRFAVREGRWKLLLWPGSGGWSSPTPSPSRWLEVEATDLSRLPPYQLYDLDADPGETTNLADRHPDVVQRLGRTLRAYINADRGAPATNGPAGVAAPWPQLGWMKDFAHEN
ncbi:MAG TPA: arylsulfatase [Opitutaceae bacterium]|nr:arylsulfatase [Opitutaceae bacterium]